MFVTSNKCFPTAGRFLTSGTPANSNSSWEPTPLTNRRWGDEIAPAHRITSLVARKQCFLVLPGVETSARKGLSVTAITSRSDGLSYAFGTSTGHTLLYDVRSPRPFAMKDQGYGLPVKHLSWLEGGTQMAGDGMLFSADKKVIKIWDRNDVSLYYFSTADFC